TNNSVPLIKSPSLSSSPVPEPPPSPSPPAPTESPAGALSLPSLSSTPGSAGLELSKTSGQLPQPEIPIMSPTTAETAKTPEVPTASPTTRTAK
ncbi:hypothetical protein WUBG_17865, partial [Wuchereria bancrofti]